MKKLTVALATFNEEENIKRCLDSVKNIADEIVIVDGFSSDKTRQVAENFGARIKITTNKANFHINKQMAIDMAEGLWILQLDADEFVSPALASEIKKLINMSDSEIEKYEKTTPPLFKRHQEIIEKRDGLVGQEEGSCVAFFVPRANYFLGRYLRHGGVYPDGVIRLFKKGKAYLPCIDVHEQYVVKGKVGWLKNDLLHFDSPTFKKYISRNNRYTSFIANQYKNQRLPKNLLVGFEYVVLKPVWWFLLTYLRHKGFLDSWQGFTFSFFSSLRFPISYIKYLKMKT